MSKKLRKDQEPLIRFHLSTNSPQFDSHFRSISDLLPQQSNKIRNESGNKAILKLTKLMFLYASRNSPLI